MIEHKKLIRFLIVVICLFFGWFVLYDIWLFSLDEILTIKIAEASGWLLNGMGYDVSVLHTTIAISNQKLVYVGAACNAMVLMAIFTGFIIAYPGPIERKLVYIPFGIILINMVNILRVTLLAMNALIYSQTLSFNHKYTFTLIVYAFIFGLWMLWVKKISIQRYKDENATAPIHI